MSVKLSAIVALEKYHNGIGKKGNHDLLWKIPEDQKYFADKVRGHVVIMGRSTFENIKRKPISGTTKNIVITRQKDLQAEGFVFYDDIYKAIKYAKDNEFNNEVFVVGGAEIYKLALPYTDRLYLTLIDGIYNGLDAKFPEYKGKFKTVVSDSGIKHSGGYTYSFVVLEK